MQYDQRSQSFKATAQALNQRYNRFSVVRLVSFIGGVAAVLYLASLHPLAATLGSFLFLLAFAKFVAWHQHILKEKAHYEALHDLNQREIDLQNHRFAHLDNGSDLLPTDHPYAVDLDILGSFSLFQYLNRTATSLGRTTLARYLLQPATLPEIAQRQAAAADLSPRLDWRQHFQAIGYHLNEAPEDLPRLHNWLGDQPVFLHNRPLKILMIAAPAIFWASIIALFFGLPYQLSVLFFFLNLFFLQQKLKQVNQIHEKTGKAADLLAHYADLLHHIETADFQAVMLTQAQQKLRLDDRTAAQSLRRLAFLLHQLNARYNVFAILLNGVFLWDWHWVVRLERWKAEMQPKLPEWFEVLQTFDAAITLGTLHYNHPNWVLPTLDPTSESIEALGLGHPLLPAKNRICNDLTIPQKGHLKLLTGSNMAGKSTFLRTVGINIVLAMAGCPVCAESLRLPPLQVLTSMRTQDALQESTSSFYAELKRLKTIIDAVERDENVFFLLDEILKGTNSRDRHTGSKALIQQLIQHRGCGIIATHDLELGSLEATANGSIENLCLEVEVENDRLYFDYKVKKGVSKSFNATYLMRNMGIRV